MRCPACATRRSSASSPAARRAPKSASTRCSFLERARTRMRSCARRTACCRITSGFAELPPGRTATCRARRGRAGSNAPRFATGCGRVRGASAWTDGNLTRTEGTRKLKRAAIRDWVRSGARPVAAAATDSLESLLARFTHGRDVSSQTTLEELGLSSLERVELMIALEDRFQTRLDEARFSQAASVADLKQLVEQPTAAPEVEEPVDFPSWNRTWPVRIVRRLSHATWIVPLCRAFAWARVEGREPLRGIDGPGV